MAFRQTKYVFFRHGHCFVLQSPLHEQVTPLILPRTNSLEAVIKDISFNSFVCTLTKFSGTNNECEQFVI